MSDVGVVVGLVVVTVFGRVFVARCPGGTFAEDLTLDPVESVVQDRPKVAQGVFAHGLRVPGGCAQFPGEAPRQPLQVPVGAGVGPAGRPWGTGPATPARPVRPRLPVLPATPAMLALSCGIVAAAAPLGASAGLPSAFPGPRSGLPGVVTGFLGSLPGVVVGRVGLLPSVVTGGVGLLPSVVSGGVGPATSLRLVLPVHLPCRPGQLLAQAADGLPDVLGDFAGDVTY